MYVINSFDASFEAYTDSVSTILADEELKKEYAVVIESFSEKLNIFITALQKHCSANFALEDAVLSSFGATSNDTWDTAIKLMEAFLNFETPSESLSIVKFDDIFNPQTLKVISKPDFLSKVTQYISLVDSLVKDSKLFNSQFDDYNAREFGSTIEKTKIFAAKHKLLLNDGTIISSIEEWKTTINAEMERIYSDPSVEQLYIEIDKVLNANAATRTLRGIIKENRNILNYFEDIELLKKRLWLSYTIAEQIDLKDLAESVRKKESELEKLNEKAQTQLLHWKHVVDVFTHRFRAPFTVSIDNESKVIFKGEPARLKLNFALCESTILHISVS